MMHMEKERETSTEGDRQGEKVEIEKKEIKKRERARERARVRGERAKHNINSEAPYSFIACMCVYARLYWCMHLYM